MAWKNNYNSYEDDPTALVYDLRQTYAKLLEAILFRCAEAKVNRSFVEWFEALDDLHTEINQKLDKAERTEYNTELKSCVKILNENAETYNNKNPNQKATHQVKVALKKLEMWLKIRMDEHGMYGVKDMEDDGL